MKRKKGKKEEGKGEKKEEIFLLGRIWVAKIYTPALLTSLFYKALPCLILYYCTVGRILSTIRNPGEGIL